MATKREPKEQKNAPLNDGSWRSFIFTIFVDSDDASNAKLQLLGDWISGGYRQRFNRVTRQQLISWVLSALTKAIENSKTKDSCRELKSTIDSGSTEMEISPVIVARVLKAYLLDEKQTMLDAKAAKIRDASTPEEKKKDIGKKAAAPSKSNTKLQEVPVITPVEFPSGTKKKEKLRDRGTGSSKDKLGGIGDEPVNGPDAYYYLQDLNSPEIIIALSEELGHSIDVIIRAVSTEEQVNEQWKLLKLTSKNISLWRRSAWLDITYSDFKDIKECFEIISRKIYSVLEMEKTYQSFYEKDKVVVFPPMNTDKPVLRYYNYLVENCNGGRVNDVELALALALESILRPKDEIDRLNSSNDALKINFDEEFRRFLNDPTQRQSPCQIPLTMLELADKINLNTIFAQSLKSIGLDPERIVNNITENYSTAKYVNLFNELPIDGYYSLQNLVTESSYFKSCLSRCFSEVPSSFLSHLLHVVEFERICNNDKENLGMISLDDWRWCGLLPTKSMPQAIQRAKLNRPEVAYSYSNPTGSLLLMMKSPGPLGCLEYRTTRSIHVRTKMGFGIFHDLYDQNSEKADGENAGSRDSRISYDTQDRLISLKVNEIFMYPADGIIVKASENVDKKLTRNTVISWSDNTFCYNSEEQGPNKQSAKFTANFHNGETLSVARSSSGVKLQFSDNRSNHYIFTDQGYIIVESYAKAPLAPKEKEKKRVVTSSGVVIRHFDSGSSQVLFPDGSVASRSNKDAEWVTASSESGLSYSVESRPLKNEIEISREDSVAITAGDKFVRAEHSCGTIIRSEKDTKVTVEAPEMAKIAFTEKVKSTVMVSEKFQVERAFAQGQPNLSTIAVLRDDLRIDFDEDCNITIKLSSLGFAQSLPEGRNIIQINLREGSMHLIDCCGTKFSLDKNFTTNIVKPENLIYPEYSFGAKAIRKALKNAKPHFLGNYPVLFAISANGEENYELKRDCEMLKLFNLNYDNVIEEEGPNEESVKLALTKSIIVPGMDQNVVVYSQNTRYNSQTADLKLKIAKQVEESEVRRKERYAAGNNGLNQELLIDYSQEVNDFKYSKEIARLKSLLIKLAEDESKLFLGRKTNQQSLDKSKNILKANIITREEKKRADIRQKVINILKKVPKYFDSPEGKAFLASIKPEAPTVSVELEPVVEVEALKQNAKFNNEDTKETISEPLSTDKAIAVELQTTGVPSSLTPSLPTLPVKVIKKERKLRLPSSIYGMKPGAIPNTKNIEKEAGARRPLNTSSTAKNKKMDANYGVDGFVVYPSKCKFGDVKQNQTLSMTIELKNVGIEPARFIVKTSKLNNALQVSFKHGPVAPGMSVKLKVELKSGNRTCVFNEVLNIVSETEILTIPVTANVI